MKELGLQTIAVAEIDDSGRLRPLDEAWVTSLAENIRQINRLRQPIEVRLKAAGGYALIAGGHRLAAIRSLGRAEIPAFVFDGSDDEARLAEIDENLIRHELSPLDRAVFLLERRDVFLRLHPRAYRGGAPGKAGGGKQTAKSDTVSDFVSFAKATSLVLGLGDRTIERAVKIGMGLATDVRARVAGTVIAKNQAELLALTKMPHDEQRAVVAELLSDAPRANSVSAAHQIVLGGVVDRPSPDDVAFTRLVSQWGRAGAKAKRQFLMHLKKSGDLTKYSGKAAVVGGGE
jgi:ParB family transcriptional regulator, chromosome partitioning protein